MRIMILEDDQKDLLLAMKVAREIGFTEIDPFTSLAPAKFWLEQCIQDARPLPELMLLDLDLGYESGYELLRLWHKIRPTTGSHLIVWCMLGDNNREICELFKIDGYVSKWEGESGLRNAIERLNLFAPAA